MTGPADDGRIDRRAFVVALTAAPVAGWAETRCGGGLLGRAMARAGGRARLQAVRSLAWTGNARVHAGGRTVAIGVATELRPFGVARSTSWLANDGPGKARTMIVGPDGGWLERDGTRIALPPATWVHERAQFAIYGLMLLAPLCAPGTELREEGGAVLARHPAAPPTRLIFAADARLIAAENIVPDPDGGAPIAQRFDFGGEITSHGICWPRTIAIRHHDAPYFELTLTDFTAGQ